MVFKKVGHVLFPFLSFLSLISQSVCFCTNEKTVVKQMESETETMRDLFPGVQIVIAQQDQSRYAFRKRRKKGLNN